MSRIVIFGAGGRAGRTAVAEALTRGHDVTAVVRDVSRYQGPPDARVVAGDVLDAAAHADGADAVISAVHQSGADFFVRAAQSLTAAGARRIVVVGLASVLPTADGTLLMDTAGYPQEWRDFYLAHAAGVAALDGDWAVVSPAGDFDHDGPRLGRYRVTAADAGSRISYADLAIALIDEAEQPRHHRQHIGVGWFAEDSPSSFTG
ncbi:NAD(P)-dependent oxidoreductase [Actinoplanes auranticolor]|uniref:NAD(P)-dependent oxidoreductase n=1 Tax=Actinoplanes auranticolor TaxID=47988 RepID=UPI001BB30FC2|nr:NAD(P)H-binding protein [Actinoplanes auranticolor]